MNNIKYFSNTVGFVNLNRILIKTYLLFSITVFFSALMSFISIKVGAKLINPFFLLIFYFFNLFLINYFKKSFLSLFFVFVLTGFIGYSTGPIIAYYLHFNNGSEIVLFSLFTTGLIFFALSMFVFIYKKSFSFLDNFLFVGFVVIISVMFFNIFFNFVLVHLILCGFFIIFSSASILYNLSSIINDGVDDYIDVAVSLYLSVYNIFINILSLFGFLSRDD